MAMRSLRNHFEKLQERLLAEDTAMTDFHLWPSSWGASASFFLEDDAVRASMQRCLRAAAKSSTLISITLSDLPEPDLENAVALLTKTWGRSTVNVQHLTIRGSQSTTSAKLITELCSVLSNAPNGRVLKTLSLDCRIRVPHQTALEAMCKHLAALTGLEKLRLHLLPRITVEKPRLSMDTLFEQTIPHLGKLRVLSVTCGYPKHNPYRKPLIMKESLDQLPTTLRVLRLENLGFNDQLIAQGLLPTMGRLDRLQHLMLGYLPTVSVKGYSMLLELVQQNTTLQQMEVCAVPMTMPGASKVHVQDKASTAEKIVAQLQLLLAMNRAGRPALKNAVNGSAGHARAWEEAILKSKHQNVRDELMETNLLYTLVRDQCTIAADACRDHV